MSDNPTSLAALIATARAIPHPRRGEALPDGADPETRQQIHCGHRTACLDLAAAANWPALECGGCDAFELMSEAAWREEVRGLADAGIMIIGMCRDPAPCLKRHRRNWRRDGR